MDTDATEVGRIPLDNIAIDHSWPLPKSVKLDDRGWLIPKSKLNGHARYTAESGLLRDFARLEHADEGEIIERASEWGLLRHWVDIRFPKPPTYSEPCAHVSSAAMEFDGALSACDACRPETVSEWREMARLVRVLLDVIGHGADGYPLDLLHDLPTHRLHVREQVDFLRHQLEERERARSQSPNAVPLAAELRPVPDALTGWVCHYGGRSYEALFFGERWPANRKITAFILSPWIEQTTYLWFDGSQCWLRTRGLAGELAIQLLSLADGLERAEVCSHCRLPFEPRKRRKRPGDASYCNDCHKRADFEAIKRRISRERRKRRVL